MPPQYISHTRTVYLQYMSPIDREVQGKHTRNIYIFIYVNPYFIRANPLAKSQATSESPPTDVGARQAVGHGSFQVERAPQIHGYFGLHG